MRYLQTNTYIWEYTYKLHLNIRKFDNTNTNTNANTHTHIHIYSRIHGLIRMRTHMHYVHTVYVWHILYTQVYNGRPIFYVAEIIFIVHPYLCVRMCICMICTPTNICEVFVFAYTRRFVAISHTNTHTHTLTHTHTHTCTHIHTHWCAHTHTHTHLYTLNILQCWMYYNIDAVCVVQEYERFVELVVNMGVIGPTPRTKPMGTTIVCHQCKTHYRCVHAYDIHTCMKLYIHTHTH